MLPVVPDGRKGKGAAPSVGAPGDSEPVDMMSQFREPGADVTVGGVYQSDLFLILPRRIEPVFTV